MDGTPAATGRVDRSIPFPVSLDETLDIASAKPVGPLLKRVEYTLRRQREKGSTTLTPALPKSRTFRVTRIRR